MPRSGPSQQRAELLNPSEDQQPEATGAATSTCVGYMGKPRVRLGLFPTILEQEGRRVCTGCSSWLWERLGEQQG